MTGFCFLFLNKRRASTCAPERLCIRGCVCLCAAVGSSPPGAVVGGPNGCSLSQREAELESWLLTFQIVVWPTVRGALTKPARRVKSVILTLLEEACFCHTVHLKLRISIVFRRISQRMERNNEFIRLKREASQVINSNNNLIRL